VNSHSFEMEVHFVHKSSSDTLAVIGVFLNAGEYANPLFRAIWNHFPKEMGQKDTIDTEIDLRSLLPDDKHTFRFMGSLTTPDCRQGVKWFVMRNPVTISNEMVSEFKSIYGMNRRPVQPLNGREVFSEK
jgi:carbonic anhydrase